jgi:hypothetical protein
LSVRCELAWVVCWPSSSSTSHCKPEDWLAAAGPRTRGSVRRGRRRERMDGPCIVLRAPAALPALARCSINRLGVTRSVAGLAGFVWHGGLRGSISLTLQLLPFDAHTQALRLQQHRPSLTAAAAAASPDRASEQTPRWVCVRCVLWACLVFVLCCPRSWACN